MKQYSSARFESECKKVHLICDGDTPLGVLHDFLMHMKGEIVDRMVKAQKDEEAMAEAQKEIPDDGSSTL